MNVRQVEHSAFLHMMRDCLLDVEVVVPVVVDSRAGGG